MWKIRKTYDVKFKRKAVDLYLANSAWHCSKVRTSKIGLY